MYGILIGDSITKYVTAERLGLKNHLTFSYPGARIQDVKEHLRRLLGVHCSDTLRYVAVHCGTNNLGTSEPNEIVDMMVSLLDFIGDNIPSVCKILVGQILPRNDNHLLDQQRRTVNRKLKKIIKARSGKVFFFHTEGIFEKSAARRLETKSVGYGKEELLAKDGLHLSFGPGVSAFGRCLRRALKTFLLIPTETNGPPTRRFVSVPKQLVRRCTTCTAKGHANGACAALW